MRGKKLFSIITVTYNDKENLENTVQNVIEQKNKLNGDLEYIVIDGASSDGTIEMLNKYKKDIDVIMSEPDDGLYQAMNKGLLLATGVYVNFMNGGDTFVNKDTLVNVKTEIGDKKTPDLVYGDALERTVDGDVLYKRAYSHKNVWYGMFTHHQSMFYKLDLLNKKFITYDEEYKIAADYAFTYKALNLSKDVEKLDLPICVFLQGGFSSNHIGLALNEQNIIRKNIGKLNGIQILFLNLVHKLKNFLRKYFLSFYNLLRYKKVGYKNDNM